MRDVFMFCDEMEGCVCENVCCQECGQRTSCANRCQAVLYKQKMHSSEDALLKELDDLAKQTSNWLITVAAEKIREGCAQC